MVECARRLARALRCLRYAAQQRWAWPRRCVLLALTAWAVVAGAPLCAQAADGPGLAIVFPLQDPRARDQPAWLGLFLQTALRDGLLRSGQGVLPRRTAAHWQRALALAPGVAITPDDLRRTGAQVALGGQMQTVLNLTRVELWLRRVQPEADAASAAPAEEAPLVLEFVRAETTPGAMADAVLRRVFAAGFSDLAPPLLPQPEDWAAVQAFYTLAPFCAEQAPQAPEAAQALARLSTVPGLGAKAHAALAVNALALAGTGDGAEAGARRQQLDLGLEHVLAALREEPWHPDWTALKGELHILRRQYVEAKAEASAARQRDPGAALPLVVLAMEAGLSSGMGRELMREAHALDPFLVPPAPPGWDPGDTPAFQGGVLNEVIAGWQALDAPHTAAGSADYQRRLRDGIALFEANRWDEAQEALQDATQAEAGDFRPWLYLARILIKTDKAAEAVPRLKDLAAENPLEPDVQYYYGVALARTEMYPDAAEAFGRVLEEEPDHRDAQYFLAVVEMAQQHWARALAPLQRLLLRNPTHEGAWVRLGVCYTHLQQWEPAREALHQAQAINPQSPEAAAWLTRLETEQAQMQRLGETPGAVQGAASQAPVEGSPTPPDAGHNAAAPAAGN